VVNKNKIMSPPLLTKTELEWLLGNTSMSKSFEYKIKSTIKKKINKFLNFELPLLIENQILEKQLIQDILDNPNNMLLILGKEKVAGSNPAQGFDNSSIYDEFRNKEINRPMLFEDSGIVKIKPYQKK